MRVGGWQWCAMALLFATGCVSLLGDFDTSGGSTTAGADGGLDANADGPPGDAAGEGGPGQYSCALLSPTFRKVADLSMADGGSRTYEHDFALVHVGSDRVRIVIQESSNGPGPTPPTRVYTFRGDRANDGVTRLDVPDRVSQVLHREQLLHLVTQVSNNFNIYAMPDPSDGTTLDTVNVVRLLAAPPAAGNMRGRVIHLGNREYFGIVEYKPDAITFRAGVTRATLTTAGTLLEFYAGPDELSYDGDSMLPIGPDVYAFLNPAGVTSATPVKQRKFPSNASSAGVERDVGTGLFPISAIPLGNGTVQMLFADLSDMAAPFLRFGTVKETDLFTFPVGGLKSGPPLTDPDKIAVGPGSAFVAKPNLALIVGKGGRAAPPSTGLNAIVYDANDGSVLAEVSGTGKNLLMGNDRIVSVAADTAPAFLGALLFDVAWIEHIPMGDYDALFFQRLQCDKR